MHTSEVKARDTSSRSESAEAEHSPDREPRMARAENFYRATERTERVAEFFSWPLLEQPSFGFALETPLDYGLWFQRTDAANWPDDVHPHLRDQAQIPVYDIAGRRTTCARTTTQTRSTSTDRE